MNTPADPALLEARRVRRDAAIESHMRAENDKDFDGALATFGPVPRYELMLTPVQVFDTEERVREYYRSSRTAFPDQRNKVVRKHFAEDAVIVEFVLKGTHLGPFMGLPPTGRTFEARMVAIFLFDDDDQITTERIYFDMTSIAGQLGLLGQLAELTGGL